MIPTAFAFATLAAFGYVIIQLFRMALKRPGAWNQVIFGSVATVLCFMAVGHFTPPLTREQRIAAAAEARAAAAQARKAKADAQFAQATKTCTDQAMFFVIAQKFVRQSLKAPATAEFPSSATQAVQMDECRMIVSSHVDAQNGFGAQIRSSWAVDLEYRPASDDYVAHRVEIQ